jgi:hypothetical protein
MRRCLIPLVFLVMAEPVRGEVIKSEGRAEAYVDVRTGTEACGWDASPECPVGQPCFVRIYLEGQAARALYDAIKRHGTKIDDFSGNPYVGTQSDALACYEEDGNYSCQIGYNAFANVLAEVGISDCE